MFYGIMWYNLLTSYDGTVILCEERIIDMTKDEFINTCIKVGYCNRSAAIMYSEREEKEDFTEDDFIEVYRIVERAFDVLIDTGKYKKLDGFKTTKRYKQTEKMGSDKNE